MLFVEAQRHGRHRGAYIDGQLGEVMKESAEIALSLRALAHVPSSVSTRRRSRARGSTYTCPPVRCPRTDRRRVSR